KDSEVREALEPMTALAMKHNFSIIGLMHFNKSNSANPLSLLMGSMAFGAVARSVHVVMQDPEDDTKQRRLLGTVKNNLGRQSGPGPGDLATYTFHIESTQLASETDEDEGAMITTSKLIWDEHSEIDIHSALKEAASLARTDGKPKKETKTEAASQWLKALFEKHDRP